MAGIYFYHSGLITTFVSLTGFISLQFSRITETYTQEK